MAVEREAGSTVILGKGSQGQRWCMAALDKGGRRRAGDEDLSWGSRDPLLNLAPHAASPCWGTSPSALCRHSAHVTNLALPTCMVQLS